MVGQAPPAAPQPYQQSPGQHGAPPPPGQQPYQPMPGQPQPPSSEGKTLLTVIIILVVVVAIVVAGVILIVLSQDGEPDENNGNGGNGEKVTVNLAAPQVHQRDINGTPYWDATFTVNKITPKDMTVDWSDVRIVIKSATGSVLVTLTEPIADNPAMYDDDADGSVDVQIWYDEIGATADGEMEQGEKVKLTGLTYDFQGATVQWLRDGVLIASATLQTNFP